ncbi:hypothetical protein MRX96_006921 [Rhipicephalus microplus]
MLSLLPSDRGRRCHCLFEGPGVADATWYGAGRKNVAGRSARHSRKALDAAQSAINADSQPLYASSTWENNSNKRPCRMLSLLPSDRGRRCHCLFEGPGVADATWYGAGRKNVAGRSAWHSRKALDAARSAINADSQPRFLPGLLSHIACDVMYQATRTVVGDVLSMVFWRQDVQSFFNIIKPSFIEKQVKCIN